MLQGGNVSWALSEMRITCCIAIFESNRVPHFVFVLHWAAMSCESDAEARIAYPRM